MGIVGSTSHSTHVLGHFGDGGVIAASARIVAAVSAEASSTVQPLVCAVVSCVARPLLITVVCMCVI